MGLVWPSRQWVPAGVGAPVVVWRATQTTHSEERGPASTLAKSCSRLSLPLACLLTLKGDWNSLSLFSYTKNRIIIWFLWEENQHFLISKPIILAILLYHPNIDINVLCLRFDSGPNSPTAYPLLDGGLEFGGNPKWYVTHLDGWVACSLDSESHLLATLSSPTTVYSRSLRTGPLVSQTRGPWEGLGLLSPWRPSAYRRHSSQRELWGNCKLHHFQRALGQDDKEGRAQASKLGAWGVHPAVSSLCGLGKFADPLGPPFFSTVK